MNYGYQPMYGNPYQQFATQTYRTQQQAMPQAQSYEAPFYDVRFVTQEEAKAYIVMPNTRALLIDRQGGVAHLKTADNMGQSVTQYFRFEPINADGTPMRPKEEVPQVDFAQFLTKDEIHTYGFVTKAQYENLLAELHQMKEQMQRSRPNGTKPNNQ